MSGNGPDLLKPFLPGLEAALDDPDVSEIMINGPGNVWLEGHGRLRRSSGPRSISRGPWAWHIAFSPKEGRTTEHGRPLIGKFGAPDAHR